LRISVAINRNRPFTCESQLELPSGCPESGTEVCVSYRESLPGKSYDATTVAAGPHIRI